jgi:hypothetical protein
LAKHQKLISGLPLFPALPEISVSGFCGLSGRKPLMVIAAGASKERGRARNPKSNIPAWQHSDPAALAKVSRSHSVLSGEPNQRLQWRESIQVTQVKTSARDEKNSTRLFSSFNSQ